MTSDYFTDKRRVIVTYKCGARRKTFVGALKYRFRNKPEDWQDQFFFTLFNGGYNQINDASYKLENFEQLNLL